MGWLRMSPRSFKTHTTRIIDHNDLPELKSDATAMVCQSNAQSFIEFERFSSYNRLRRAIAYMLKFVYNIRIKLKSQRKSGALLTDELDNATKVLARVVQQQSFPIMYDALVNNLPLKPTRNISFLNVFLE